MDERTHRPLPGCSPLQNTKLPRCWSALVGIGKTQNNIFIGSQNHGILGQKGPQGSSGPTFFGQKHWLDKMPQHSVELDVKSDQCWGKILVKWYSCFHGGCTTIHLEPCHALPATTAEVCSFWGRSMACIVNETHAPCAIPMHICTKVPEDPVVPVRLCAVITHSLLPSRVSRVSGYFKSYMPVSDSALEAF